MIDLRSGLTFLPHVSPRIPHSLSFPASSPHHNAQVMFPIGQGTRVWGRLEGFQERLLHTSAIPVCRISRQQSCYLSYFPFQTFMTSSSTDSICQFIKEENGFQPFSPVYRKAESNGQESRFFLFVQVPYRACCSNVEAPSNSDHGVWLPQ